MITTERTVLVNSFSEYMENNNMKSSLIAWNTNTITKKHDGPSLFMKLPSEIRRQILEYTCVVLRPLPNLEEDGLTLYEGHCEVKSELGICCGQCKGLCRCPSQQCACYKFSSALFYTCKTLSMEARESCFSMNRFKIIDRPQIALDKFLKRQPQHLLRLIRDLEFYFGPADLCDGFLIDYEESHEAGLTKEWQECIHFVGENFKLCNLTLSIDASLTYITWLMTGCSSKAIKDMDLTKAYDRITSPLQQLSGLNNLFIHWPCYHKLETVAEKAVMGPDYDAYQHGKIPVKHRAPGYPRGDQAPQDGIGIMGNYDPQD